MKKLYLILLFLTILIGALLRLWDLGGLPRGFFRDEAALGYNAYSIWNTGKDEYGIPFPTVFRSFEVFFLPLYVYVSAPIVGLFGLSEFTTRILSASSGIAALGATWLLTYQLWRNKKISFFATLALAISPWHIFYSRGAFEGNLALTLFELGFWAWIKFLDTEKIRFYSLFLFASILSMYSYQTERFVVPILSVFAVLFSFKLLYSLKTKLLIPTVLAGIIFLPLLSLSFQTGGYHRAIGVSIFNDKRMPPGWDENKPAGIFSNNFLYLRTRQLAALYTSYFSPRNLFSEGDYNLQRGTEKFSVFYGFFFPFLILGILYTLKKNTPRERLLFILILLSPIPAALTTDPFHTYRSLPLYLGLTILVGVGMAKAYKLLARYKPLFLAILTLLVTGNLALFLFDYSVLTQMQRVPAWDYGYKEMVEFMKTQSDYTEALIDDPGTEAYIHFLFFGKVDPEIYHKEVQTYGFKEKDYYSNPDELRPNQLGKIKFRPVDWPTQRGERGTIYVMKAERLPESEYRGDPIVHLRKIIYYPNSEVAFRIVKIEDPQKN
ncbi:MAG: glycosyltransferase family 39 protein [bacterium]|nr:glycosyltransferase family 39 protein [bacterium]